MEKTEIRKCVSCNGKGYTETPDDKIANAFIRSECSICDGTGKYEVPISISSEWLEEKKRKENEHQQFTPIKKEPKISLTMSELNNLIDTRIRILSEPTMKAIKDNILKIVSDEVRSQINTAEVHKIISNALTSKIENEVKPLTSEIIHKFVNKMYKEAHIDLKRAQEINYSINKEIKHIMMKLPISINKEEFLISKIQDMLKVNRESSVKLIENE